MKYINTYEKTMFYNRDKNQKFDVDEDVFVVRIGHPNLNNSDLIDFLDENPGKIHMVDYDNLKHRYQYYVEFSNVPKHLEEYLLNNKFKKRTILPYVDEVNLVKATPEDLENYEMRLTAIKYNI